jgi:uncharacterized phage protein gp47/JayE
MEWSELNYIDATGYHFPDYPTTLAWLTEKYKGIYGQDIYVEPDSQDGEWLAIQAKALYDTAASGASTFNSFAPPSAQGTGLARLVKINGLNKRPATYSTVDLTVVGQAGTVLGTVGAPATAVDTLDQKWDLPIGTVIPGGGTIIVTATAQQAGAVQAAANTVNRIFTPTRGWQTVDNVNAATAGVAVETDAELRARQAISTANPSTTVLEGTAGAVANLPGVVAVRPYENDTGVTDGNGIPGHKISIAVIGGDVTEICETILTHKTPGCGTYGDTSEVVNDPKGIPSLIAFERPADVPIEAEIVISINSGYTSDYADQIKAAVAAVINQFGIGNDVLYTRLFIPAYLQGTPAFGTFDIVSIEISRDGDPVAAANVDIAWNERATCVVGDITVIT